jgi:MYXO-CTERM domain-containing protein
MSLRLFSTRAGLFAGLLVAGVASTATAAVVSLQQGTNNSIANNYQGTEDTFISSAAATTSYGRNLAMLVRGGTAVSLLRFDLSLLVGQYSTINSATLTVYQREGSAQNQNFDMSLFQVSSANAGWVPGATGTAVNNQTGSSNWNFRVHDTQSWAGSAGLQTVGTDYLTPALGTVAVSTGDPGSTTDTMNVPSSFSIPASVILDWIGGNNSGLVLQNTSVGNSSAMNFATSQWNIDPDGVGGPLISASIRPQLTIDYTPVPEPGGMAVLALGALLLHPRRRRA